VNLRRITPLALLAAWPATAAAQGPGLQMGHLFTDPPATTYRLGSSIAFVGPLGVAMHATVVDGRSPMGNLWGAGIDGSLFRSGQPGLYLLGGVEGGLATRGDDTFWGSWSAGLGYEVFPFGGLSLAAEGRYRDIGPGGYRGVEVGFRLALDGGNRRNLPPEASNPRTPPSAPDPVDVRTELGRSDLPEDRATLIGSVVQTALDAMGMPYRWGDEGETGFDCSGLIRYAFGRHGVALPRRSIDQAREGREVGRDLAALRPGDVLTFATGGSRVSHVGLYVGNGKFIHSASQGVQISVLSDEDASGRWWFRRWVGARRIVG
jgi:hypothetical protein